jgi:hypothetical protein
MKWRKRKKADLAIPDDSELTIPLTLPAIIQKGPRPDPRNPKGIVPYGQKRDGEIRRFHIEYDNASGAFRIVPHALGAYCLFSDVNPESIADHSKIDVLKALSALKNALEACIDNVQRIR